MKRLLFILSSSFPVSLLLLVIVVLLTLFQVGNKWFWAGCSIVLALFLCSVNANLTYGSAYLRTMSYSKKLKKRGKNEQTIKDQD